jgi:hypothetical protein
LANYQWSSPPTLTTKWNSLWKRKCQSLHKWQCKKILPMLYNAPMLQTPLCPKLGNLGITQAAHEVLNVTYTLPGGIYSNTATFSNKLTRPVNSVPNSCPADTILVEEHIKAFFKIEVSTTSRSYLYLHHG